MTPGTRPSRRIARAAPLPARGRPVALISLTIAMSHPHQVRLLIGFDCSSGSIAMQTAANAAVPPGRPPGVHPGGVARLIAGRTEKNKKARLTALIGVEQAPQVPILPSAA